MSSPAERAYGHLLFRASVPGFRLHPLKGDLKGFWSVTISGTGVSFSLENGQALDVDLVDYH